MEPWETRLVISIKSDLRASTKACCCVRGITVTECLGKDPQIKAHSVVFPSKALIKSFATETAAVIVLRAAPKPDRLHTRDYCQ